MKRQRLKRKGEEVYKVRTANKETIKEISEGCNREVII